MSDLSSEPVVRMADEVAKGSHSPGPWLINHDAARHEPGFYGTPNEPGEEEVYTSIKVGDLRLTGFMRPADSRLIAAAPTMFDYVKSRAALGCSEAQKLLESIHASR